MISLDQVLLLEEKVESAVARIAQLNAENAALRRKCAELTNALSAKTEQFSSFQSDQGKIEEGILKALERLNSVENAVHAASQTATNQNQSTNHDSTVSSVQPSEQIQNTSSQETPAQSFENINVNSFDTADTVEQQPQSSEPDNVQQSSNQATFDIF